MQVYSGKNDRPREKKLGFWVVKYTVCNMHGTRGGVTTDNLFTRCERVNFLFTNGITLGGTLRKNKPQISALFLGGKQRQFYSSSFPFTSDVTLVSHVPVRNEAVILLSLQRHNNTCVHGWRISHKPEVIMHSYATNSGCNVLDKLVRECTCIGSIMLWTLKLFFISIAVVCVNASVLWMLKYPKWQQRKSYCKNMYLLSLREEIVWPHIWMKTDSGNVNRHTAGH